jgi:hypothetical protein
MHIFSSYFIHVVIDSEDRRTVSTYVCVWYTCVCIFNFISLPHYSCRHQVCLRRECVCVCIGRYIRIYLYTYMHVSLPHAIIHFADRLVSMPSVCACADGWMDEYM